MENEFRKLLFDGLPHPSASEACLFDCLRAVVPLILSEDKCKEPSDANLSAVCTHSCHKVKMVMRDEMVMVMMTTTMAMMFTGMAKNKKYDVDQCNAGLHRVHASKPPGDLLQPSLITDSVTTDLDKDARNIESQTLFKNKRNQPTLFWKS